MAEVPDEQVRLEVNVSRSLRQKIRQAAGMRDQRVPEFLRMALEEAVERALAETR